jgi:hypothetical protein
MKVATQERKRVEWVRRSAGRVKREKVRHEAEARLAISASSIGAVAELVVAADLLRRGYEVYRAVSPAASCDLVILREGRAIRVEVKSARRGNDGSLEYDRPKAGLYDVLALARPSGEVLYRGMEMRGIAVLGSTNGQDEESTHRGRILGRITAAGVGRADDGAGGGGAACSRCLFCGEGPCACAS